MREDETKSRRFAKELRAHMTNAEVIFWSRLRQWRGQGIVFRRQHPIGPYIADYACVSARLVLEIDGETHGSDAEIAHDRRRDAFLRAKGWRVIRVTNDDVYKNLNNLLDTLIDQAIPPPSSPSGPTPPP